MFIKGSYIRGAAAASLLLSAASVQAVGAQSLIGKWEGMLYAQGQSIPVVITLDSTAAGWSGTLLVAQLKPDPIVIATVSIKKDTVTMQLPEDGMNAFIQGLLTADRKTLNGMVAVQGDNSGTFQVTKTPMAAKPAPAKPAPPAGQK